jgi:hypothetical protein
MEMGIGIAMFQISRKYSISYNARTRGKQTRSPFRGDPKKMRIWLTPRRLGLNEWMGGWKFRQRTITTAAAAAATTAENIQPTQTT